MTKMNLSEMLDSMAMEIELVMMKMKMTKMMMVIPAAYVH